MKRKGNLFNAVADEGNLKLAFRKAAKGKRCRKAVQEIERDLDNKVKELHEMLIVGAFHTSAYRTKTIYEPKKRLIYILPFWPDRVVQHAILNVVEPYWEKLFIETSYSCIRGRGQHKCSERCMRYVRHYRYVYKADIRHFYPSLSHSILKRIVRKKIKDSRLLTVLDDIIDSVPGDVNVPIGNLMSQWFGNLYMNELDMFVKHTLHCRAYVRYCDDFLLFSNDKEQLRQWKQQVECFIDAQLGLAFSESGIFPAKYGVDFMGYRHFPEGYLLVRKSTAKREARAVAKMRGGLADGTVDAEHARSVVESVHGWVSWANSFNFMNALRLPELREEVRSMQSYAELVKRQQINEDGEKLPIADIIGREITVTGFDMRPSNMHKSDYLCLKFETDGKKHVVFTDSDVLKRECTRFADDMPFTARIVQKGQYYTFS